MADSDVNKKDANDTDETIEDTIDTVETPVSTNKSKVFTQEDLNRVVSKERKTWNREKTEYENTVNSLKTELEDLQKVSLESMLSGHSDAVKKAVARMAYKDALEYLSEIKDSGDGGEQSGKKKMPSFPSEGKKDSNEAPKSNFKRYI